MNLFSTEVELNDVIVKLPETLYKNEIKVNVNCDSEIKAGDSVFIEYDGLKAFGTCIEVNKELLVIDFTTELSSEPKQEKFIKGLWKK